MRKNKPVDPSGRKLVKVSESRLAPEILWALLEERPRESNISHRAMPTPQEHLLFVKRYPYRVWYLIQQDQTFVGAIYLTRRNEIGVGILRAHQRKGHATWAIKEVMRMWAGEVSIPRGDRPSGFLANVAPTNQASRRMFEKLGFTHIQDTLRNGP